MKAVGAIENMVENFFKLYIFEQFFNCIYKINFEERFDRKHQTVG